MQKIKSLGKELGRVQPEQHTKIIPDGWEGTEVAAFATWGKSFVKMEADFVRQVNSMREKYVLK